MIYWIIQRIPVVQRALYRMKITTEHTVDGLRFIDHLHTTARQLYVCSEVVTIIGTKQVPLAILSQLISAWSTKEEKKNLDYKKSKGKLTEGVKSTTALQHYVALCKSLGLISGLNNFYTNTRLAYLLIHFISKMGKERKGINEYEKCFYFFQLMNVDADGILLLLHLLENGSKNQSELQQHFKEELNKRLDAKKDIAPANVKETIREKYRVVNVVWKKPEKYAEHVLIPRCSWLETLGIIQIERKGSSAVYSLSQVGREFLDSIPKLSEGTTRDITEGWLFSNFFGTISRIYLNGAKAYTGLIEEEKKSILAHSLNEALIVIKTSTPSKISLFDTLLFVCISTMVEKRIFIEFSEIVQEIEKGIYIGGKQFILNEVGRINESYIATRDSNET